ncbi:hypothetical protein CFC21_085695 [Triticum aestivum]|uniref:Uncharacterized protein n=2 Tax=Triticum aestivum TaxID=4565 RepID=A0A3B6PFQ4_WHEAT|nr:receptor-like protein EIX1 [Triticum aestivum]KAF7081790.1 hypothetical protein CFC21_085695 [Triticum aestivum]
MAVPRQLLRVTMILTIFLVRHAGAQGPFFPMPLHPRSPALPPTPGGTLCVPRERDALLEFKAGLTDPINFLSSWRGVECCQWTGIICSNRTGHVVMLKINSGWPLDSSMHRVGGEIRSSLLTLRHLKQFDLSGNNFGGQPIPELIGALGCGRLTHLDLSGSNFGGRIPPHLGNLSNLVSLQLNYMADGTYSPDLAWVSCLQKLQVLGMSEVDLSAATNWLHAINMLPRLTDLDLSYCALQNSMSPPAHSNLTSLENLNLISNSFNTSLGAKNLLWDMPGLQNLFLTSCGIDGPIPDAVGNLTSIRILYLGSNKFTGMVPLSFRKLQNLTELVLDTNFIIMDMAELMHRLGHLSSLATINLDNNELYGDVPVSIRELINLNQLSLAHNNLHGTITEDHFTYLTALQTLDISDNSLTMKVDSTWKAPFNLSYAGFRSCIIGPKFPSWLNQPTIYYLDVSNTSIHDSIPLWIVNPSSEYLDLSRNRLVGMLPDLLSPLQILDVSFNEIVGPIPTLPDGLLYLDLSGNNLSGALPSVIGAPMLEVLLLFNNSFSGTIPCSMLQSQQLKFLDLSRNLLDGRLSRCSRGFDTSTITLLKLNNNHISGAFPLFLQKCKELKLLDLAYNKFFGSLPTWIESKLPQLALLNLRSNMFSGGIPGQLTRMRGLQFLDIACNNISGNIPRSLGNLKAMTFTSNNSGGLFDLVNYIVVGGVSKAMSTDAYTVEVGIKGQVLEYTKGIAYMVNLDFSGNRFTGQIPKEIGMLVALKNLNLSWNSLTGIIPQSMGALQALESFDLSHNGLSGEIPTSISSLTSLTRLNLSYNDLTGNIPSGNQLRTLEDQESIYIGNPGLCGPPVPRNCSRTDIISYAPRVHNEGMSDVVSLYLSMCIGFVVGLWIVFCGFLFKRKWRIGWFSFTDHMYDRAYMHVAVGWASLARNIHQG